MILVSTLFIALFITLVSIPMFKSVAMRAHILDIPNERKVHSTPIPKSGGLAMALGFCVAILYGLTLDRFIGSVIMGSIILVAVGLVDDRYVIGYRPKFLSQIAAALVVIIYGGVEINSLGMLLPAGVELPLGVSLPLTLLVIVGVTNAINLADGLDGLAGGITLIIFLCLFALAYQIGDNAIVIMCIAMLGALFGFLSFNTYPASVFMGDAGSQLLGFVSIVLALRITQANALLCPVLPLLIVGFPIIDTCIVMFERIRAGRSPFVADNNHFHHKLLSLGLFHTEAVFIIYLLQTIFVACAYIFRFSSDWFVLGLYFILSGIIITFFQVTHKHRTRFKRYEIIDKVIKGKLRFLKNRDTILFVTMVTLDILLPLLMIINCIAVQGLPVYISVCAFLLGAVIVCLWVMDKQIVGGFVRVILYFMIPAIIYLNLEQPFIVYGLSFRMLYLGCCFICILSALILVRLNRSKGSFQISPMDFLILIIALSVSPLINTIMNSRQTGFIIVQILIFFYSYEILFNNSKRGRDIVIATTIITLGIIAMKGF
jgi:UDP-GlcNAc:undecaprenyl-phosphate/decaprenyl-phosphate GlcNAc-1-phosphate transferase